MSEEEERDKLNIISMQVILHAGNARDIVMNVLDKLADETPDFEDLSKQMSEARKEITQAHQQQTDMLQKEASGEFIPYSVLFGHAQDTLMTIQSELTLVEKLLPVIKGLKGA